MLENKALEPDTRGKFETAADSFMLTFGTSPDEVKGLKVVFSPFSASLLLNGKVAVGLNTEGMMNFEQYREKNPKPTALPAEEGQEAPAPPVILEDKDMPFAYDVPGMWEEGFGGHTDTKPRGPEAVAMDITFNSEQVYGIPEHATDFALKNTDGNGEGAYQEPYRLYNLDVFEYELDVPMALYGAVPFMLGHDQTKTSAMLWLNSAETFIDVADSSFGGKRTRWVSESGTNIYFAFMKQVFSLCICLIEHFLLIRIYSIAIGIIDIFLMTSADPKNIFKAYGQLTGLPSMPQRFAIAYHQVPCPGTHSVEHVALAQMKSFFVSIFAACTAIPIKHS